MTIEHCVVLVSCAALFSFVGGIVLGGLIEQRDELLRKLEARAEVGDSGAQKEK